MDIQIFKIQNFFNNVLFFTFAKKMYIFSIHLLVVHVIICVNINR